MPSTNPRISLTDFVNIVSASGTPKATLVSKIKHRPAYDPRTDFYKRMRDHILYLHEHGGAKADLSLVLNGLTDTKKITNYPAMVNGYCSWWGNKTLGYFVAHNAIFSGHGIDVSVNPEIGLNINGTAHLVKLYFKSDTLTKAKADIVIQLMQTCLNPLCQNAEIMSVLDIRRSKLIVPTVVIPNLTAILQAELSYIATLWPLV